jgi:pilus assembly protein CpaE
VRNPRVLVADRTDGLFAQVRRATAGLRPRPDVVACTRVGTVDDVLAEDGPYDVLVAGPSLVTGAGLHTLRRIRLEHPATTIVMASGKRPDASLRDIVRAGAVDVLQLPVDDEPLGQALEEAIAIARRAPAAEAEAPRQPAEEGARLMSVVSATGGSGKTFLATNLAYYLHTRARKRVCIVDLDLQFGELSTALRLRPRYTIADALARDDGDEEDLAGHIEEFLMEHDTGLFVLAGPADPVEAEHIEPSDVMRVLAALRARFDVVIVDTPAMLSEAVLTAVDLSDRIVAIATLDLPSVRNMGILLSTLNQLKIPEEHVQLLLNKVETDVGIDVAQVTRYFPQGFAAVIPYGREVSRSLNMGMPILAYLPTADVSKALLAGLGVLVPEAHEEGASPPGRRRRLRRRERGGGQP